jgi:drug/metabolite transporter (DMT)-like permease
MIYLLLCILSNLLIFVVFRIYPKFNIPTFPAIVMNYFFCVVSGLAFNHVDLRGYVQDFSGFPSWGYLAIFLSFAFILTFTLMARTTQLFGVTVGAIASKLSLVIPVSFSLLIFSKGMTGFSLPNYLGLGLALIAIVFASIKKEKNKSLEALPRGMAFLLPVSIFFLGGMLDTLINFANIRYLQPHEDAVFVTSIFALTFVWGMVRLIQQRQPLNRKAILGGLMLGIPNYFSMIFLLKSLEAYDGNGALIYPLINIGIIIGGTIVSLSVFKDRLLPINYLGVFLSLLSLVLISWK